MTDRIPVEINVGETEGVITTTLVFISLNQPMKFGRK
jgi:hypothetical protein